MRFALALLAAMAVSTTLSTFATAYEVPDTLPVSYRLDISHGGNVALYPGEGIRSSIDPKYKIASLAVLEERVALLPPGMKIVWTPAKYATSGKPLLFGNAHDTADFEAFCKKRRIDFAIELPTEDGKPGDAAKPVPGAKPAKE